MAVMRRSWRSSSGRAGRVRAGARSPSPGGAGGGFEVQFEGLDEAVEAIGQISQRRRREARMSAISAVPSAFIPSALRFIRTELAHPEERQPDRREAPLALGLVAEHHHLAGLGDPAHGEGGAGVTDTRPAPAQLDVRARFERPRRIELAGRRQLSSTSHGMML